MDKISRFNFILLCLYFPLSLFSTNQGELKISDLGLPLLYSLLFGVFIWFVLRLALKNTVKASILTSIFVFIFFSHGHFYGLLPRDSASIINILGVGLGRLDLLYIIYFVTIILGILLVSIPIVDLNNISKIITFIAMIMVVMPTVNIIYHQFNKYKRSEHQTHVASNIDLEVRQRDSLPDVFYIILDRYPNAETLRHYYGYNNSIFLSKLASKGFYVANGCFANYLKTGQSLCASLNMEYINYLSNKMKCNPEDWTPIYESLLNNKLLSIVKRLGYKTIWSGSWWEPTAINKYCDENINYNFSTFLTENEFSKKFLETTALYHILMKLYPQEYDFRYIQWKRVQYKIGQLNNLPCSKRPVFVFAHFLLPHPPFVFHRDGSFVKDDVPLNSPDKDLVRTRWLDQLIFTNGVILGLVSHLLEKCNKKPIIVLQGDEGPFPKRYADDESNFNWKTQVTKSELYMKFGILNAIYLPSAIDKENLFDRMTPVNTFRIISNLYFGSSFKILPNKSYVFENYRNIYSFKDITSILREQHGSLLYDDKTN